MKTALCFLLVTLMAATSPCAQPGSGHKSEEQIARMTPDQRVEEYCREHSRHLFTSRDDDEYVTLLTKYLEQDGLKVMPQVIREMDAYDPTRRVGASEEKFRRYEGANFILDVLDVKVFRVRAFEEGRKAIEATRRSIERMRAAHFDNPKEIGYEMHRRYEVSLGYLKDREGLNMSDRRIQDTLRYNYDISLSDDELLSFVNYLISQDPHYPAWSERESFRNHPPGSKNSKWLFLYKNPEPFHRAYLEYKAKKSASKQSQ